VFTPKGQVKTLPAGSTPIDFAYAIHSDVGNTCVGAKVNGRIVQLKYNLKNGDVVEILTQTGHMPSKDWLGMVKTPRARNKIKHLINATEHAKAIEIGQKYLEREARRLGVQLSRITKADLERVAGDYGCGKMEDLHAALGYGAPTGLMMLLSGWLYARYGGLVFLAMAAAGGAALLFVAPLARETATQRSE